MAIVSRAVATSPFAPRFGKPGARNTYWVRASTARYQAMTMPWLAEMLSPGCTLIDCGQSDR